jgi:sugar-specific transcriptional regulator TrmB/DNA-binding CsgD family transcriptional regulator
MLTALGATETEDSVYCFVATTVSATGAEIRSATGLSAGEVRVALAGLQRRGLVSPTSDDPVGYVASSPGTVEAMISNRLRELREAQEVLDLLADKRRAVQLSGGAAGVFELVHGQQALRHHVLHLLHTARSEVMNMVKPPVIAVQSSERALPNDAAHNRVIFETGALEAPGTLDAIRDGMTGTAEVRVHTKLPVKMLAIDRCVALVPLVRDDTMAVGVLIYPGSVLDGLLALFEHVWDSAVALHMVDAGLVSGAAAEALSTEDKQLLSLLLAGLTDEAIAAHFRISVRTVQRKVHALMEMANVRTRMQLAWEAARQDWLPGPAADPSPVPRPRSPQAGARTLRVIDGTLPPVQRR